MLYDGKNPKEERETFVNCVNRMVDRALPMDGTCTGEHGIGVGKKEKLVKELNNRFVDWYYVVSGNSFENLRQGRKTLVKEKGAATAPPAGEAPPGLPPGINIPGLN